MSSLIAVSERSKLSSVFWRLDARAGAERVVGALRFEVVLDLVNGEDACTSRCSLDSSKSDGTDESGDDGMSSRKSLEAMTRVCSSDEDLR